VFRNQLYARGGAWERVRTFNDNIHNCYKHHLFFLEKRYTLTHSGLRNGSLKQSKKNRLCSSKSTKKSQVHTDTHTHTHTHTHTLTHTRIAKRKGGGFEADLQAKNSHLDRLMCNTPLVKDTPPSFIRDFVNDDIVRDGTCVFGMEFKTNGKKKGRTNNNKKNRIKTTKSNLKCSLTNATEIVEGLSIHRDGYTTCRGVIQ